ncbi:Fe-S cluster assembly protein SufD [Rhizobium sp. L1K21]|uniref:Fe-S cluster assembly protein SufD n=1 Tax=Rhizobium sp. L1K21 TaxID=2954933 RepID=UPI00209274FB|nr:Fe-S cluster assembly protein SufD [Rhizobium sp. L1K21]MCO6185914.1 Fe-S cluster assembly protein SufD [Rhizobium sp. L1K21]
MTAQNVIALTQAESALIDTYNNHVGSLPGDENVLLARDNAIYALKTHGLPSRRIEAWHYTDLRALLREVPADDLSAAAEKVAPLLDGSSVFTISRDGSVEGRVEGATVRAYDAALLDGSAAADLSPLGDDDAIGRINGGLVNSGFEISFEDGVAPANAIEIQMFAVGGQLHSRLNVNFGRDSKVRIVERHIGTKGSAALSSLVSDIKLGDGAEVEWIILQQEEDISSYLGQLKFALGENAKFSLFILNAGGKLVREEIHGVTKAPGADFQMRVINLLGGDSHTDVTMVLGHDVPETTSTEVIRNIVFDKAKGVFQGQIRVAPDAQKTDARMACNSLLLSDAADFSAKPELEIFADDVQCAHGATVADIDRKQLYYLMSRGIPESKARGLLVQAFVAELVEEMEGQDLIEALENVIADWLEARDA